MLTYSVIMLFWITVVLYIIVVMVLVALRQLLLLMLNVREVKEHENQRTGMR